MINLTSCFFAKTMPRCGASFTLVETAVNHKRQSICTRIGHAVPFDGARVTQMLKQYSLSLSIKALLHFCKKRASGKGRKWCDQKAQLSTLAFFLQSSRRYKFVHYAKALKKGR